MRTEDKVSIALLLLVPPLSAALAYKAVSIRTEVEKRYASREVKTVREMDEAIECVTDIQDGVRCRTCVHARTDSIAISCNWNTAESK